MLVVHPDPKVNLLDAVLDSQILAADRELINTADRAVINSTMGAGAGPSGDMDFGVDPNMDPELALVRSKSCHYRM